MTKKQKILITILIILLLLGVGIGVFFLLKGDKKPVKEDVYVTITFDTDGGSVVDSKKIKEGSTITLPESKKEGFALEGWYNGEKKVLESTKYDKDTTLKAKWIEAKTFKVTFDSKGGNKIEDITMICGNKLELPEDPTKKGYTFVNWQDKGGKVISDGDLLACDDITLTANWEKEKNNTYTVTFDSKGGSKVSSIKVECDKTLTLPKAPTKDGYTFVSWADKNGKVILDGALLSCEDVTLYANWEEISKKEYTCPEGYKLKENNKCVSMKTPEEYCPDGYAYSDKATVCYKYSANATKSCKDGGYFISGNGTADDKCGYEEVTRLTGNVSGCTSEVGGIMLNNHCFRRVEVGSSYFTYACPNNTSYRTAADLGGTQNSGCYSFTKKEYGCKNFDGYSMDNTYGVCVKTIDAIEK